jgi:hypothetical protein
MHPTELLLISCKEVGTTCCLFNDGLNFDVRSQGSTMIHTHKQRKNNFYFQPNLPSTFSGRQENIAQNECVNQRSE